MIQDIGPHQLINSYDASKKADGNSKVLLFRGRELLVKVLKDGVDYPTWDELVEFYPALTKTNVEDTTIYLFTLDDTDLYLVKESTSIGLFYSERSRSGTRKTNLAQVMSGGEPPEGFRLLGMRALRALPVGEKHVKFSAITGIHLARWYRNNRFCGCCGQPTVHSDYERALQCTACGNTIYPRIQPAVIVGVTKGDKLLHTKYADRDMPYYALIAGFTEIGETMEETVQREVMEEVGLKVKNIRYYKSQPWGIADDILMGFYCDVDGSDEVHLDTNELKEGVWIDRKDIEGQPDDFSLTNEMMMVFRDGKEPR